MKKVAIIEARMTSSRLSGKILMELCGKLMIERVRRSKLLDDIVLRCVEGKCYKTGVKK